ncbi:hypothetical protein BLNAU_5962 [Blattamonas nauphoetae]|uniref:Uncharacterized protein n=1 Tax=Blattamonas nauphoetae TaxID=2049346 RepID=A0ABQ9Y609_9EUKA|nr:hypothetical protein BLNAU_5962 [Blattamonas nauphoetae]
MLFPSTEISAMMTFQAQISEGKSLPVLNSLLNTFSRYCEQLWKESQILVQFQKRSEVLETSTWMKKTVEINVAHQCPNCHKSLSATFRNPINEFQNGVFDELTDVLKLIREYCDDLIPSIKLSVYSSQIDLHMHIDEVCSHLFQKLEWLDTTTDKKVPTMVKLNQAFSEDELRVLTLHFVSLLTNERLQNNLLWIHFNLFSNRSLATPSTSTLSDSPYFFTRNTIRTLIKQFITCLSLSAFSLPFSQLNTPPSDSVFFNLPLARCLSFSVASTPNSADWLVSYLPLLSHFFKETYKTFEEQGSIDVPLLMSVVEYLLSTFTSSLATFSYALTLFPDQSADFLSTEKDQTSILNTLSIHTFLSSVLFHPSFTKILSDRALNTDASEDSFLSQNFFNSLLSMAINPSLPPLTSSPLSVAVILAVNISHRLSPTLSAYFSSLSTSLFSILSDSLFYSHRYCHEVDQTTPNAAVANVLFPILVTHSFNALINSHSPSFFSLLFSSTTRTFNPLTFSFFPVSSIFSSLSLPPLALVLSSLFGLNSYSAWLAINDAFSTYLNTWELPLPTHLSPKDSSSEWALGRRNNYLSALLEIVVAEMVKQGWDDQRLICTRVEQEMNDSVDDHAQLGSACEEKMLQQRASTHFALMKIYESCAPPNPIQTSEFILDSHTVELTQRKETNKHVAHSLFLEYVKASISICEVNKDSTFSHTFFPVLILQLLHRHAFWTSEELNRNRTESSVQTALHTDSAASILQQRKDAKKGVGNEEMQRLQRRDELLRVLCNLIEQQPSILDSLVSLCSHSFTLLSQLTQTVDDQEAGVDSDQDQQSPTERFAASLLAFEQQLVEPSDLFSLFLLDTTRCVRQQHHASLLPSYPLLVLLILRTLQEKHSTLNWVPTAHTIDILVDFTTNKQAFVPINIPLIQSLPFSIAHSALSMLPFNTHTPRDTSTSLLISPQTQSHVFLALINSAIMQNYRDEQASLNKQASPNLKQRSSVPHRNLVCSNYLLTTFEPSLTMSRQLYAWIANMMAQFNDAAYPLGSFIQTGTLASFGDIKSVQNSIKRALRRFSKAEVPKTEEEEPGLTHSTARLNNLMGEVVESPQKRDNSRLITATEDDSEEEQEHQMHSVQEEEAPTPLHNQEETSPEQLQDQLVQMDGTQQDTLTEQDQDGGEAVEDNFTDDQSQHVSDPQLSSEVSSHATPSDIVSTPFSERQTQSTEPSPNPFRDGKATIGGFRSYLTEQDTRPSSFTPPVLFTSLLHFASLMLVVPKTQDQSEQEYPDTTEAPSEKPVIPLFTLNLNSIEIHTQHLLKVGSPLLVIRFFQLLVSAIQFHPSLSSPTSFFSKPPSSQPTLFSPRPFMDFIAFFSASLGTLQRLLQTYPAFSTFFTSRPAPTDRSLSQTDIFTTRTVPNMKLKPASNPVLNSFLVAYSTLSSLHPMLSPTVHSRDSSILLASLSFFPQFIASSSSQPLFPYKHHSLLPLFMTTCRVVQNWHMNPFWLSVLDSLCISLVFTPSQNEEETAHSFHLLESTLFNAFHQFSLSKEKKKKEIDKKNKKENKPEGDYPHDIVFLFDHLFTKELKWLRDLSDTAPILLYCILKIVVEASTSGPQKAISWLIDAPLVEMLIHAICTSDALSPVFSLLIDLTLKVLSNLTRPPNVLFAQSIKPKTTSQLCESLNIAAGRMKSLEEVVLGFISKQQIEMQNTEMLIRVKHAMIQEVGFVICAEDFTKGKEKKPTPPTSFYRPFPSLLQSKHATSLLSFFLNPTIPSNYLQNELIADAESCRILLNVIVPAFYSELSNEKAALRVLSSFAVNPTSQIGRAEAIKDSLTGCFVVFSSIQLFDSEIKNISDQHLRSFVQNETATNKKAQNENSVSKYGSQTVLNEKELSIMHSTLTTVISNVPLHDSAVFEPRHADERESVPSVSYHAFSVPTQKDAFIPTTIEQLDASLRAHSTVLEELAGSVFASKKEGETREAPIRSSVERELSFLTSLTHVYIRTKKTETQQVKCPHKLSSGSDKGDGGFNLFNPKCNNVNDVTALVPQTAYDSTRGAKIQLLRRERNDAIVRATEITSPIYLHISTLVYQIKRTAAILHSFIATPSEAPPRSDEQGASEQVEPKQSTSEKAVALAQNWVLFIIQQFSDFLLKATDTENSPFKFDPFMLNLLDPEQNVSQHFLTNATHSTVSTSLVTTLFTETITTLISLIPPTCGLQTELVQAVVANILLVPYLRDFISPELLTLPEWISLFKTTFSGITQTLISNPVQPSLSFLIANTTADSLLQLHASSPFSPLNLMITRFTLPTSISEALLIADSETPGRKYMLPSYFAQSLSYRDEDDQPVHSPLFSITYSKHSSSSSVLNPLLTLLLSHLQYLFSHSADRDTSVGLTGERFSLNTFEGSDVPTSESMRITKEFMIPLQIKKILQSLTPSCAAQTLFAILRSILALPHADESAVADLVQQSQIEIAEVPVTNTGFPIFFPLILPKFVPSTGEQIWIDLLESLSTSLVTTQTHLLTQHQEVEEQHDEEGNVIPSEPTETVQPAELIEPVRLEPFNEHLWTLLKDSIDLFKPLVIPELSAYISSLPSKPTLDTMPSAPSEDLFYYHHIGPLSPSNVLLNALNIVCETVSMLRWEKDQQGYIIADHSLLPFTQPIVAKLTHLRNHDPSIHISRATPLSIPSLLSLSSFVKAVTIRLVELVPNSSVSFDPTPRSSQYPYSSFDSSILVSPLLLLQTTLSFYSALLSPQPSSYLLADSDLSHFSPLIYVLSSCTQDSSEARDLSMLISSLFSDFVDVVKAILMKQKEIDDNECALRVENDLEEYTQRKYWIVHNKSGVESQKLLQQTEADRARDHLFGWRWQIKQNGFKSQTGVNDASPLLSTPHPTTLSFMFSCLLQEYSSLMRAFSQESTKQVKHAFVSSVSLSITSFFAQLPWNLNAHPPPSFTRALSSVLMTELAIHKQYPSFVPLVPVISLTMDWNRIVNGLEPAVPEVSDDSQNISASPSMNERILPSPIILDPFILPKVEDPSEDVPSRSKIIEQEPHILADFIQSNQATPIKQNVLVSEVLGDELSRLVLLSSLSLAELYSCGNPLVTGLSSLIPSFLESLASLPFDVIPTRQFADVVSQMMKFVSASFSLSPIIPEGTVPRVTQPFLTDSPQLTFSSSLYVSNFMRTIISLLLIVLHAPAATSIATLVNQKRFVRKPPSKSDVLSLSLSVIQATDQPLEEREWRFFELFAFGVSSPEQLLAQPISSATVTDLCRLNLFVSFVRSFVTSPLRVEQPDQPPQQPTPAESQLAGTVNAVITLTLDLLCSLDIATSLAVHAQCLQLKQFSQFAPHTTYIHLTSLLHSIFSLVVFSTKVDSIERAVILPQHRLNVINGLTQFLQNAAPAQQTQSIDQSEVSNVQLDSSSLPQSSFGQELPEGQFPTRYLVENSLLSALLLLVSSSAQARSGNPKDKSLYVTLFLIELFTSFLLGGSYPALPSGLLPEAVNSEPLSQQRGTQLVMSTAIAQFCREHPPTRPHLTINKLSTVLSSLIQLVFTTDPPSLSATVSKSIDRNAKQVQWFCQPCINICSEHSFFLFLTSLVSSLSLLVNPPSPQTAPLIVSPSLFTPHQIQNSCLCLAFFESLINSTISSTELQSSQSRPVSIQRLNVSDSPTSYNLPATIVSSFTYAFRRFSPPQPNSPPLTSPLRETEAICLLVHLTEFSLLNSVSPHIHPVIDTLVATLHDFVEGKWFWEKKVLMSDRTRACFGIAVLCLSRKWRGDRKNSITKVEYRKIYKSISSALTAIAKQKQSEDFKPFIEGAIQSLEPSGLTAEETCAILNNSLANIAVPHPALFQHS